MVRIRIKKIGINGEGIGFKDKLPVFCDGALKGELVDVTITNDFKKYKIAKLNKIIESSDKRRKPPCLHADSCQACPLMIEERKEQLKDKRDLLIEALHKYANINSKLVRNIHSKDEFHYRNQCKLPIKEIDGKLVSGMYKPKSNSFISISNCLVHDKKLEIVRKEVLDILNKHHFKAYNKKLKRGIRYIVIRSFEETQLTIITGNNTKISKECLDDLMKIDSLTGIFQSINTTKNDPSIFGSKVIKLVGKDTIELPISDYKLSLSPAAFFQLNTEQAKALYEMVVSKIDKCDVLVEAYAGIGAMSLLASSKANEVYAIEYNEDAIKDGKLIAANNNIQNIEYICNDASKGLYKVARMKDIDTLLVDPPRSGLDTNMINAIQNILPKRIVYVSCNPSTLAKNLNILKKNYHIRTIIPFDLFPNTPLVESITVLDLI